MSTGPTSTDPTSTDPTGTGPTGTGPTDPEATGARARPRGAGRALQLRTKLLLTVLALLTVACAAVGALGLAVLNVSLGEQLDGRVRDASFRTIEYGVRAAAGPSEELEAMMDVPAQGAGTLNARVVDGEVVRAGLFAPDGTRQELTDEDRRRIGELVTALGAESDDEGGRQWGPVDVELAVGGYRVLVVDDPWDWGLVLTGLPLADKEDTLRSFGVSTAAISTGAIAATGLVGLVVVRRTLRPVERLSDVATRISELDLDHGEVVLPVGAVAPAAHPDTEVGRLGHAFGRMLDNVAHALATRQRSETRVRRFVADASHELRTPLASIRGYAELIRLTEPMSAQGRSSLSRVESEAARMTALVEDLLLLARLDEGRAAVTEDVDLLELVVETVSDLRVAAPGHVWRLELPDEPVLVRGDPAQLRQVLINLLANAHQHTPAGTTVTASLGTEAGAGPGPGGEAVLAVGDDGPGIGADFLEHIFSRFAREDHARAASSRGAGLGLSIVDAIVRAHHGRIDVSSVPGRTRFTVRLPLADR
ncbi:sensor histidine kinase [Kocuria rosea]|uniref:sensor histidine kinase n=1 Tax=Kocuria rosea TaxID=1275 RepID=UPI000D64238E|nr:HAMP domain-containing sensor histidine kinase [Kocuria rosea]MEB2526348.1 HAMP domain-containing sensor histidine kinase [Kocuria rosea]MEB2619664.1 HAMP domain-containing sensor histidine kinase [Kocuria rosea]PWF85439.1 sensor histidine kinase [Kocuria rosea]QCY33730.1 HAMP domain-containing histidine kinase [Kocuria rosea]TQN35416.1 two-component system OmpR family sensor kinase [Kocuria rosea]